MKTDAADGQIEIFHRQQCWLVAEFTRLRRLPRTARVLKDLRELGARGRQIDREIQKFMERHS